MTLEQYKQMINSINNQIKILEKNRSFLIEQNHDNLLHQIKKKQTNDKNWFINNFDAFGIIGINLQKTLLMQI